MTRKEALRRSNGRPKACQTNPACSNVITTLTLATCVFENCDCSRRRRTQQSFGLIRNPRVYLVYDIPRTRCHTSGNDRPGIDDTAVVACSRATGVNSSACMPLLSVFSSNTWPSSRRVCIHTRLRRRGGLLQPPWVGRLLPARSLSLLRLPGNAPGSQQRGFRNAEMWPRSNQVERRDAFRRPPLLLRSQCMRSQWSSA